MTRSVTPLEFNKTRYPLLGHFKSTTDRYYIYDSPTNKIMEVGGVCWLESRQREFWEMGACSGQEVKALKEAKAFQIFRPDSVNLLLSEDELRRKLDSEINQVIIGVTEACNLRCAYCVYSGQYPDFRYHGHQNMEKSTAVKAVDFFLARNHGAEACNVSFYGGEPTLNLSALKAAVSRANHRADREVRFNLTSNGYQWSDETMRLFVDQEFSLLVSVDGPETSHDRYRKSKANTPTFSRIYRNLSRLRELDEEYFKTRVRLAVTLTPPYDIGSLQKFFDTDPLFEDVGLQVSGVNDSNTSFFEQEKIKQHGEIPVKEQDKYESQLAQFKLDLVLGNPYRSKFLNALFQPIFLRLVKRGEYHRYPSKLHLNSCCVPGVRRIFVATDGKIGICEKASDTLRFGSVDSGIDFKALRDIIDDYSRPSSRYCVNCFANRLCPSCFASNFNSEGFNDRSKNNDCIKIRNDLLATMVHYCEVLEQNPKAFDYMEDIIIS